MHERLGVQTGGRIVFGEREKDVNRPGVVGAVVGLELVDVPPSGVETALGEAARGVASRMVRKGVEGGEFGLGRGLDRAGHECARADDRSGRWSHHAVDR